MVGRKMEHDVANTVPRAQLICNGREMLRRETLRISNVPSILMFTLPQEEVCNVGYSSTRHSRQADCARKVAPEFSAEVGCRSS